MGPPQVKLNEKPPAEASLVSNDPLPEKDDGEKTSPAVIITVDGRRPAPLALAEQRRQRKRCRIACCASLSFLLVLMLALGTACLVYRMKHRKSWRSFCGTKEGDRLPEHVNVDHDHQLIYVKPEHHSDHAMEMLHEYNRRLIAFKNGTAKTCYLDRLDETFADGYARWQGYEESVHVQNRTLRVFQKKIDIQVVKHIADVHIFEHCGKMEVEYHWVMEVTMTEVREYPEHEYITV
eukprot:TRINITY_DN34768_c0_g1_i6.p1 TRINITY_DN34768_c0_g1~~TRINITY_DN34768_c0_g1_i6.p1  ORF type:complete len:236 (+),score=62.11 TRINITY_DN34768_c0_g1_i6:134-841(+)